MATEIASAYVSLYAKMPGVQDDITKALGGSTVQSAAEKSGEGIGSSLMDGLNRIGKVSAVALGGTLAAGIGTALVKGFQRLDSLDQAEAKLKGLGHSAGTVDTIMDNALASVKGTAFGMDEAAQTAANAVAAGIKPGTDLERTLKAVADASTIAGTDMGSMGAIFNKVAASNKVQMDVVNQLHDAGVPALALLADQMGVTAEEAAKMASAGEIDFATFQAAMENGMGGAALASGDTFSGAMDNVMASLGRMGANVLSGVFPDMKDGLSGLIEAMAPLEDVAKDVGAAIGGFIGFIQDNIGWIGPLATGIGIAVGAIMLWTAVQWLLNVALTANPIGLIVVAIGLLIGAIILLVQNWDTVVAFLSDVWNGFVSWFTGLMDQFLGWWNDLWTSVWEWIVSVWDGIVSAVVGYFMGLFNFYVAIGAAIVGWWNGLWQGVFDFIASIWNNIVTGVQAYFNLLFSAISAVGATISDWWNGLWQGISDFIGTIWDGVMTKFGEVRDFIGGVIKTITDVIKGVQKTFADVAKGIKDAFDGIGKFIADAFGPIGDFLGGAGQTIANFFGGMGDAARHVKGRLTDAANNPAGGAGGVALARVRATMPSGLSITDTLSSPSRDAAFGLSRSPNSYHYDAMNPAVDIAGPTWLLDQYAEQLRSMGGWRQLLWRVAGHYDHIHVAHSGGVVSSSWPRSIGDRADERTTRLQVGETVLPRGWSPEGGGAAGAPSSITVRIGDRDFKALIREGIVQAQDAVYDAVLKEGNARR